MRVLIFPDSSAALAELERGDVVAHRYPPDTTKLFLKRIVGLPGDTLAMRAGRLLLNGRAVDEPYAWHSDSGPAGLGDAGAAEFMWQSRYLATQTGDDGGGTRLGYHPSRNNWGPLVVPPRAFFVLGDNRDYSLDSRYWGFVPAREIVGLLIDKRPNATP